MNIFEFTPTEAWGWITSGVAVGAMTDEQVSAAKERTQELYGEVNKRLDSNSRSDSPNHVTGTELIGGIDFDTMQEFFYRLWPSAVKEAREEFSGEAPWQQTGNEWAEKQLGEKPEIPKLEDYYPLEHFNYSLALQGYARRMADRMGLKLSYFEQHKGFVHRAIAEGKVVPERVLKDYDT